MLAILLIIIASFTITGVIYKTRSFVSGRRGTRFFQPLYNVGVLMRKGSVYSTTSSYVTRLAAPFYLSLVLCAALIIPLGNNSSLIHFDGDIFLFAILLAGSRLIITLAAFDSGSPFQGMGASRELLFGMLAEPAFYLFVATLALITGHYSFSSIFAQFDNMTTNMIALSVIVGFGVFKLSLAECGRLPMDDPKTHLELTMIHEAMILDVSGFDLGLLTIASWVKLSIFALLTANTITPPNISLWLTVVLTVSFVFLYGVVIGALESLRARNSMQKNSVYLTTVSAIALISLVIAYLIINGLTI